MNQNNEHLTLVDVDFNDLVIDTSNSKDFTWQEEFIINIEYIYSTIRIFFRDIQNGIKNICYYFPVIWKDRYWDFEYFFLELLRYKLINTRDGLIKENIIADIENVKDEINILLNYINEYKNSDKKFEDENQDLLHKIQDTQDKDLKDKLIKEYCIKCQMYEISSRNKIFDYLKENCDKWWS